MRTIISRLALIAGVAFAGTANADTNWWGVDPISGQNMRNGNGTFFDWTDGHNGPSNLFGTPTLVGTSFYFFPSNFVAQSDINNGYGTHTASDTLEVDLHAHFGFKIDGISITERGDYSITGPSAQADIQGSLAVSDGPHGSLAPQTLGYNPVFPASSGFNTQWDGSVMTDLTAFEFGTPFDVIHISITNTLIAISVPGSSAVIRKTIVGNAMAINILPEPGVMGLVAMAGLVGARRRRS